MNVPPGQCVVHIEKGKEFTPVDLTVDVGLDEHVEKTITLRRWIDMPSRGWFSADLHVHLGNDDPRVLRQLALADDVHLVPSFTYWLRGRGERWRAEWPDESIAEPINIDTRHVITRNNIEIERIDRTADPGATIGATFLFNLRRPVTAEVYGEFFPTDASLCRLAVQQSPRVVFDSDKPSWAESVIGAALGMLHTVQVCHNHYARDSTGLGGYGMIGPLGPGESNDSVGDGLFHRTNELYYRFLNCGFPLGVSGGSAIGVKAMPTGHHRVYAHIDSPLTADKMWNAIRDGRSFATTGPMLNLEANGQPIGSSIKRSVTDNDSVRVTTTVETIQPLEALQIVHDGKVIASRNLSHLATDRAASEDLSVDVLPIRSGWIVARALFRAPDGLLRQAHTSPIYMEVDGKPIAHAEDARYMLRWIDVLADFARSRPSRYPSDAAQQKVLAVYDEARQEYLKIIRRAETLWGD